MKSEPTPRPTPLTRSAAPARAAGLACFAGLLGLAVSAHGVEPPAANEKVYERSIKPLLRERCYACHGALKQESELRVDTVAALLRGGGSGPAIAPSKPRESLLLQRIAAVDDSERMPPEGHPLTADQIELVRRWIARGAPAPEGEQAEASPQAHWAFQPPQRTPTPDAALPSGNPIDAVLARHHAARNLKPLGRADRRILLRRLYLDLIGLPPTPRQLREFVDDSRPDAYARQVDRLLASPAYGERWGRHWMDVWRYSDWYGLGKQLRHSQKHIWHWRDWILESLNADRGYDQMVRQMLAADELTPQDAGALRATGYLARHYFLFNRTTWLDETIEHTSKAFLGLTLNCAKCHDHKYDPLSQRDYYAFRAIFEPYQVRLDPRPGEIDLERDGLPRAFDAHLDAVTYLHIRGDAANPDTSQPVLPAPPQLLLSPAFRVAPAPLPPEAHFPGLQEFVLRDHLAAATRQRDAAEAARDSAAERLERIRKSPDRQDESLWQRAARGAPLLSTRFENAEEVAAQLQRGGGQWTHAEGHLLQSQTGASRATLTTLQKQPRDFVAQLEFRIVGGEKWRSVGLAFDIDSEGAREKLVYLSGVAPGAKLQASYKQAGAQLYPAEGKVDRSVALNRLYVLEIAVRDQLINVAIDGEPALAYRLPVPREAGQIALIAFDAAVAFHRFEAFPLPESATLIEPGAAPQGSLEQTELELQAARADIEAAQRKIQALRAAHRADRARHGMPEVAADAESEAAVDTQALIAAAALAARQLELAEADAALARAKLARQVADADKRPAAEQALAAAAKKRAAAAAALSTPGERYASLRPSRKAMEGPDETEESVTQPYPAESTGRRTALARWLADRGNPLTARVAVNHLWLRHFGQPLVEPVTDFGRRTPAPPLQELLDNLAVELMSGDDGWQMKRLHRLIVTSDAYCRSSSVVGADPATRQSDPENRFYWRRLPVRMESQLVRDSLLFVSGQLHQQLAGPSIDPAKPANSARRSLYFAHSRDDQNRFLMMFDDADILACYRRQESIVPQQALTLANSRESLESARALNARLAREHGDTADVAFVELAFETILGIQPDALERDACLEALRRSAAAAVASSAVAPTVGDRATDAAIAESRRQSRENLIRGLLNHNDFLTIR